MEDKIKGFIWFHGEFHSGLLEDYEVYQNAYQPSKTAMSFYVKSLKQLSDIAKILNNSNLRSLSSHWDVHLPLGLKQTSYDKYKKL